MAFKPLSALRRAFGMLWHAVDVSRRTFMNLLFLLFVILIVMLFSGGGVKPIAAKSALVLELKGDLVETYQSSLEDTLLDSVAGDSKRAVRLRDLLTVLDAAAKDKSIDTVVLLLDQMNGGGLAMLRDVGAAIDRVRASGKKVVAWGGTYDQKRYLLASHADEVYVHPMGMVLIEGFGGRRNYYRDALDKLGVTVNLIKVGTYKSFAEPYIANGPSQAAQEADSYLYNALWQDYTGQVEKNRKLAKGTLASWIETLPQQMQAQGGSAAKVALQAKLVDGLKTRDELRDMLVKRGAWDESIKSFRQVAYGDYLQRHQPKPFGDAVGVVVASGNITEGSSGPGVVGGITTANLIRQAREDEAVKAVVLRVDSPGGSAYGSELIRRELELTRAAGKPVIVSMGDVAASGGYWISMAADEVIADPATITGSIGVFTILPTAEKVGDKLGIHTEGYTTTWLADAYNPLRPLDPRFSQLIQSSINNVYGEFTSRAAAARKTTPAKIDEVGQGRVWTGAQARERGLVDRLGSYRDALNTAAKAAKLGADYRVAYIERPVGKLERFLNMMGASTAQAINIQVKLGLLENALPAGPVAKVAQDMAWLNEVADGRKPFAAITHCLCEMP
ncbi:signal peptide peptidase SppA [Massilia sp. G4R7]|uniref:Signal peptide peptidase SppA n=1 Tax=Massilia phyllostachyos TaxID=2898585 RepID=A0ABS8QA85_9BURK|nr:signal peptide peptidase SppA [Massilia phyllostachyos]MCD2518668.1 signal peptide peptidase SppA [Massilia phyllostachyos]